MEALRRTSPMPLSIVPLPSDLDGLCNHSEQTISIREGMSEVQTVCAAVHEITHAVLHNRDQERIAGEGEKKKDKSTMEIEALCLHFDNVDLLKFSSKILTSLKIGIIRYTNTRNLHEWRYGKECI